MTDAYNFKVGDRVRVIELYQGSTEFVGREYTICELNSNNQGPWARLDHPRDELYGWGIMCKYLELVEPENNKDKRLRVTKEITSLELKLTNKKDINAFLELIDDNFDINEFCRDLLKEIQL